MIKVDIDMPKMCCYCPMFEIDAPNGRYFAWMGEPTCGKCKVLPIKDLSGRVLDYQTVSTREEIEAERRSEFCPLQECGK